MFSSFNFRKFFGKLFVKIGMGTEISANDYSTLEAKQQGEELKTELLIELNENTNMMKQPMEMNENMDREQEIIQHGQEIGKGCSSLVKESLKVAQLRDELQCEKCSDANQVCLKGVLIQKGLMNYSFNEQLSKIESENQIMFEQQQVEISKEQGNNAMMGDCLNENELVSEEPAKAEEELTLMSNVLQADMCSEAKQVGVLIEKGFLKYYKNRDCFNARPVLFEAPVAKAVVVNICEKENQEIDEAAVQVGDCMNETYAETAMKDNANDKQIMSQANAKKAEQEKAELGNISHTEICSGAKKVSRKGVLIEKGLIECFLPINGEMGQSNSISQNPLTYKDFAIKTVIKQVCEEQQKIDLNREQKIYKSAERLMTGKPPKNIVYEVEQIGHIHNIEFSSDAKLAHPQKFNEYSINAYRGPILPAYSNSHLLAAKAEYVAKNKTKVNVEQFDGTVKITSCAQKKESTRKHLENFLQKIERELKRGREEYMLEQNEELLVDLHNQDQNNVKCEDSSTESNDDAGIDKLIDDINEFMNRIEHDEERKSKFNWAQLRESLLKIRKYYVNCLNACHDKQMSNSKEMDNVPVLPTLKTDIIEAEFFEKLAQSDTSDNSDIETTEPCKIDSTESLTQAKVINIDNARKKKEAAKLSEPSNIDANDKPFDIAQSIIEARPIEEIIFQTRDIKKNLWGLEHKITDLDQRIDEFSDKIDKSSLSREKAEQDMKSIDLMRQNIEQRLSQIEVDFMKSKLRLFEQGGATK